MELGTSCPLSRGSDVTELELEFSYVCYVYVITSCVLCTYNLSVLGMVVRFWDCELFDKENKHLIQHLQILWFASKNHCISHFLPLQQYNSYFTVSLTPFRTYIVLPSCTEKTLISYHMSSLIKYAIVASGKFKRMSNNGWQREGCKHPGRQLNLRNWASDRLVRGMMYQNILFTANYWWKIWGW